MIGFKIQTPENPKNCRSFEKNTYHSNFKIFSGSFKSYLNWPAASKKRIHLEFAECHICALYFQLRFKKKIIHISISQSK